MLTVHELRKSGYKVGVHHRKFEKPIYICGDYSNLYFCAATAVTVTTPDGKTAKGNALCSVKDQYNRKLGVRIALGRALKQLKLETK